MTKKPAIEELLRQYTDAARLHGEATERGDARTANRNHDRVLRALRLLDEASDEGRLHLVDLLGHADPHVQTWAATHLIFLCAAKAVPVLESVAQRPDIAGGNARMVLELWREGSLRIP